MTHTADVVICGAGIAGISVAYHLAIQHGLKEILLVDERPPLSLTSAHSAECYRNWWPGPGDAMVGLMNRSIDILEDIARNADNAIRLNRRGYLYATADRGRISSFIAAALEAASLGAGPLRLHGDYPGLENIEGLSQYTPAPAEGFEGQLTGADVILDPEIIQQHFPCLAQDTVAVVHARRAGWFNARDMGVYLLQRAREHGVKWVQARMEAVDVVRQRVEAVRLQSAEGSTTIATQHVVDAAGPYLKAVGKMLGADLDVYSELHTKAAFVDHLRLVPRDAPLLIWTDPQQLAWNADERAEFASTDETRWLLGPFPSGVHTRPEGPADSPIILMMWDYHAHSTEPTFPLKFDPVYPDIALRGLARMLPALRAYFDRMPKPVVDGGYYTRTRENRPLIGPLPATGGAYVIGAFSGFGMMASCAAGELIAAYIMGSELPHYAPAFRVERYEDQEYQKLLENWPSTGQL